MDPKTDSRGKVTCIFSAQGLQQIQVSLDSCEVIFKSIEEELGKASKQLSGKKFVQGKIVLSVSEKAKWPFLQPRMQILKADLRDSKGNLLLMLSVTTLAYARKLSLE
jgi:hypothetical protein